MITFYDVPALISGNNGENYTYTYTSDLSCVSFSNPSGTSNSSVLYTNITFEDEACVNSAVITLTVIDSEGCATAEAINLSIDCDDFVLADISMSNPFVFTTNVTGTDCNPVTFNVQYDDAIFDVVSNTITNNTITVELTPKENIILPDTGSIVIQAIDCSGCSKIKVKNFEICKPELKSIIAKMDCTSVANNTHASGNIALAAISGCGTTADWSTLSVTSPSGFVLTTDDMGTISFTTDGTVTAGTYFGTMTVRDNFNVTSDPATIRFVVSECLSEETIIIVDIDHEADLVTEAGNTIEIPLVNNVRVIDSARQIDWSTFTIVAPPTAESPSVAIGTDASLNPVIDYQVPNPAVPDVFEFTVADDQGKYAKSAKVCVSQEPNTPVATADTPNCTDINTAVTINVLSNDTATGSVIDTTSVTIKSQGTLGTAVSDSAGVVTYTPSGDASGADSFTYSFKNIQGVESNTATVDVNVINAGSDSPVTNACVETYTPYDYLLNSPDITGTWTNVSVITPTPAAPGSYNGTITFAVTDKPGEHIYRYTVTSGSCNHTADVTFDFTTYTAVTNDTCATATAIAFSGLATSNNLLNQTIIKTCPGPDAPTLTAEPIPTEWGAATYAADIWYTFTAPADTSAYPVTVTIEGNTFGETGIYGPAVAIYTGNCGALVQSIASVVNDVAQTNSMTVINAAATSTTYYVRVATTAANQGRFNVTIAG